MTDFFYYSVPKKPEEMTETELVQELHSAYFAATQARLIGQGISSKENIRKRNCELKLVEQPNGIDVWNREFGESSALEELTDSTTMRRSKPWIDGAPAGFNDELPPEVDIAQLTQITRNAIKQGEEKAAKKLAEIKEAAALKVRKSQIFAAKVLAEVPDKCYKEAERERTHAVIMDLKYNRDYEGVCSGKLPAEKLKAAGRIVYDYLVKMGLNPTIEYWWSGDGMESGHQIVAHWPKGD